MDLGSFRLVRPTRLSIGKLIYAKLYTRRAPTELLATNSSKTSMIHTQPWSDTRFSIF